MELCAEPHSKFLPLDNAIETARNIFYQSVASRWRNYACAILTRDGEFPKRADKERDLKERRLLVAALNQTAV
jgi:hypothetical protein